ncbi:MAG TPA: Hsp20/alpha crystallin family protein [Blastocatellia bacterium]|nr:Hsp20/alpha crystallin family protein [Blastocatellia bacterium]
MTPKGKKVFVLQHSSEMSYRRPSGPLWEPSADIYRTPDGWKLKFDLAGVKPEDIEVLVVDDKLIVRGVRRDSFIDKEWSYYQLEITYSRFERVLKIPCELAHAEVHSECKDGWLVLHIHSTA